MKKLFYFAAALLMTACNNEEFTSSVNDSEIRLYSNIVGSRSSQDNQLAENEIVYSWLDKKDADNTEYIKGWKMVSKNLGTGMALVGEKPKYFPNDDDTPLTVYAVHANAEIAENSDYPSTLEHTVATNQSKITDYLKSDLLYGVSDEIKRGKTNTLKLYHLLSKVKINLEKGEGFQDTDFSEASVSLLSVNTAKVTVSLSKDKKAKDLEDWNKRKEMISEVGSEKTETEPTQILLPNGANVEAIVAPQTISSGSDFIQVKIGEITLKHKLNAEQVFKSGYQYTFNISVRKSGLNVGTEIAPWEEEEVVSGDISMRPLTPIEKKIKAEKLDRGVIRKSSDEFLAYYIFNPAFTEITSYIIEKTDNKRDLVKKTQKIAVNDNYISWSEAIGGLSRIDLEDENLIYDEEIKIDANLDANTKFLSSDKHYLLEIDRKNADKFIGNCAMSTLFKEEMINRPTDFPGPNQNGYEKFTIELNSDYGKFAFTTYPKDWTSYENTKTKIGKDEIKIEWTNEYVDYKEAEKGQENTTIKNMFESYHDTNIFVPFKPESNDFYIINKEGKGWFLVFKKTN